jgi:hypothetical protein
MPVKNILAAGLALMIGATSLIGTADARHRYRHHHGDALAAGVFGLAAGALLSGAFYGPRYRYYDDYPSAYYYDEPGYYYEPAPRAYYRQAPVYYREAPVYNRQGRGYYDPCDLPTGVSKPANAMC